VNRRLVMTMPARGDVDLTNGVVEFFLESWSLDEYIQAFQLEPLQSQVSALVKNDEELIAKFYCARGNYRNMFRHTTKQVIQRMTQGINCVGDFCVVYRECVADASHGHAKNVLVRCEKATTKW
jgi:hypothetical protein